MKNLLQKSGYIFDVMHNIWHQSHYDSIAYSDGDEAEQRIIDIISKVSDLSVLSPELRQHCTDWPSLYHLSSNRANILRPFETSLTGDILEIGAGCGAITRYLGELNTNVLALEGSHRRATIARSRTRDLTNVTVLAEKFDQLKIEKKFDVITLIGVLEYANLFTPGNNPALAMLERVRSLLKPNGKLIIALENQLGLKYFAGAPEDHLGQTMYGVEGRYDKSQPQTFGRKVLANLLIEAGFSTSEFLAPFPDYKLPISIVTEEGFSNKSFDAAALAWQSARLDPQLPVYCNFSIELVWPSIVANDMAIDMANSFLIVARTALGASIANDTLAYHYSTNRKPLFCKETIFKATPNTAIEVRYRPLAQAEAEASGSQSDGIAFHLPATASYSKGYPLSLEFIKIVTRDGWLFAEISDFIWRYISLLSDASTLTLPHRNDINTQTLLPGSCFDLVPQNIIIAENGTAEVIDMEWVLKSPITLGHLLSRGLLLMIGSITRFGLPNDGRKLTRSEFIQAALASAGFQCSKDDLTQFIAKEALVQEQITGCPSDNFLNWHPQHPLPLKNSAQALKEFESSTSKLGQLLTIRDQEIEELRLQSSQLKQTIVEQEQTIIEHDSKIEAHQQHVHEIMDSRSWKLTRPLRWAGHRARDARAILKSSKQFVSRYGSLGFVLKKSLQIMRREGLAGLMQRAKVISQINNVAYESEVDRDLYFQPSAIGNAYTPRVSIIVPNFNHEPYLRQRLESIYSQTYTNFEVILLDDCSTDNSRSILQEYSKRYKNITTCVFNASNSGGVFNQWKKGFSLARGELIWIAESDDFCDNSLLATLVPFFRNEAIKLAFCRSDFISDDGNRKLWTSEEYLADTQIDIWNRTFIKSAHWLVNHVWSMRNIVANVSSAVFRHPGDISLLQSDTWNSLKLCGDWIFYLNIIRGGLVAYSTQSTNCYRQHAQGTSITTQQKDIYYQEHETVAKTLLELYRVDKKSLERQRQALYAHWCHARGPLSEHVFNQLYNLERARNSAAPRKLNILMASYALAAGGGETFPINLANQLDQMGFCITFFNCKREPTEPGVRSMLNSNIPLLELEPLSLIGPACNDLGIEIVHSHHAWVDISLAECLASCRQLKHVISMHGMYEMMNEEDLKHLLPLMDRSIDRIVYTAEKNLSPFSEDFRARKRFERINNALEKKSIHPIERSSLGISSDDFILCLVSRAIPEKGWDEAVRAVALAQHKCLRRIHLLLIGEGPEFDRLKSWEHDYPFIHFLGFKPNIRDYFAMSDMGFLPSRFKGESFPLVLIDCLLSGRPVLASNIGEISMMLTTESGVAGELFDLSNYQISVETLSTRIAELATNKQLYTNLLLSVKNAAAKFDQHAMAEKYVDVYQSVIPAQLGDHQ